MTVTVLAGGGGAPKYLRGLVQVVDPSDITAIVNTGDDFTLHGLRISPDLDSCTYVLAGAVNPETGWGLAGETWHAMEALERFEKVAPPASAAGTTWFRLGDRDLATHLYRTARLGEGADLTAVTAEITEAFAIGVRLLPMTTDRVATMVTVVDEGEIPFQDYFVRRHHDVAVTSVRFAGIDRARPGPGVLDALARRRDDVVAVSPIVAGGALKGPAARMLTELGHEASVVGIARIYAGIAGTLVIDEADAASAGAVEEAGLRCVVIPTVMSTPAIAAGLARATLA